MKETAKAQNNRKGLIFNIQKFSYHDGPGIRTLVFFKGCPLKCQWCSNPEGIFPNRELAFKESKCIGLSECGHCLGSCKIGALRENGKMISVDKNLCTNCGDCVDICPSKALVMFGEYMSVNETLNAVEDDSAFYNRSGGGITLSGGEPLLQADFAMELLREAKSRGLSTAIETSGYTDFSSIEKVFPYVDFIHYDIKVIDSERHKKFTGVSNEVVLENFIKICNKFAHIPMVARTPVIPGVNDTDSEIQAIIDFISDVSILIKYELLLYHHFGKPKYTYLGKINAFTESSLPSSARMKHLNELVKQSRLEPAY